MTLRIRNIWLAFGLVLAGTRAWAALDPPRYVDTPDSGGVQMEKGIEFLRATERLNWRMLLPAHVVVDARAKWKTDWQSPENQTSRVRQDGQWYAGVSRKMLNFADVWMAAEGEHLDDRPRSLPATSVAAVDVPPARHEVDMTPVFVSAQSVSAVRILRGGVGATVHPWAPLRANVAVGPVQDKRIGQVHSGAGLWTQVTLDRWNLQGYEQSLNLRYDRENPVNHNSEDFAGQYELFREFFAGNSNRATVSFGSLGRDVYLDTYQRSTRRAERNFGVKDVLTYGVARGLRVEMSGEITRQKTVQSQLNEAASSLEENQAGFATAVQGQSGNLTGEARLEMRAITQTVRGDILQGRKTDLGVQGDLALPGRSTLALRAAVSKYSLDTRRTSKTIKDDRDMLRYTAEAMWSKPLRSTFVYEIHALTQLDHLVYIFSQSSANNRWTRLLLLGSSVHHRPVQGFDQVMSASVSANYQDYDFDPDPLTTRSTVHRRVVLGDSLTLAMSRRLDLNGTVTYQQEEFGRLFWSTFSEERSDETKSLTASLLVILHVAPRFSAGAGALWDTRRGERFPGAAVKSVQRVFQDLRAYGPMVMVEKSGVSGTFVSLNARVLKQSQLDRAPRWISLGEMVGGIRW